MKRTTAGKWCVAHGDQYFGNICTDENWFARRTISRGSVLHAPYGWRKLPRLLATGRVIVLPGRKDLLATAGNSPHNSHMEPIYLDHNSTTPTRPEVIEAMARCYAAGYANPASQHQPGQQARHILEDARQGVAEILGADLNCLKPDRLIFTSGGTEANNLAIFGLAQAGRLHYGQVIVSSIEHASVLEAAEHLMELGWRLDTLRVDGQGVVQSDGLKRCWPSPPAPLPAGEGNKMPSPPAPLPSTGEGRVGAWSA